MNYDRGFDANLRYRFVLSNILIDEFIVAIKEWNILFQQYQFQVPSLLIITKIS